jgi:hypothetical protein
MAGLNSLDHWSLYLSAAMLGDVDAATQVARRTEEWRRCGAGGAATPFSVLTYVVFRFRAVDRLAALGPPLVAFLDPV